MSPEEHAKASELFLAACELPADEQLAFVNIRCNGDEKLRDAVLSWIRRDNQTLFLDEPIVPDRAKAEAAVANEPDIARYGPYEIVDILGEGGMGTVYRAQQTQPDRTVALKVLRPGVMTRNLQQRFEYEINVLGRLQHPGIAQIFAAGRQESRLGARPYFAMELIDGAPITEYANRAQLGIDERLELLVRLCEAVQYAHEQGVIHRDLKPANVLVDHHGQPKILDFGVSRAIDADPSRASLQTETGALVGTLAYMSPEQIEGDPRQVDTRSDVYALGVIMFELLAGELPYPIAGKPLHSAARLIVETEPRRAGSFNAATRGDLEAIIAKALAKDKAERYATASELSSDLGRYLRAEPIEAKRANALYVLKKGLYRYRVAASIVSAFVALLFVALFITYYLYLAADHAVGEMRIANQLAAEREAEAAAARDQERLQRYAAEMRLGYDAYDDANLARVDQLLRNQVPAPQDSDPRGFEWYWLDAMLTGTHQSTPAHLATIRDIAVTPNEKLIVTAGWDGAVRLWDAATFELRNTMFDHERSVNALAISRDGRLLATGGWDKAVHVWSLPHGELVREIMDLPRVPMALDFAPDGNRIMVGTVDFNVAWSPTMTARSRSRMRHGLRIEQLREFSLASGEQVWSYEEPTRGFTAVKYLDNDGIIAGHTDGTILVFSDNTRGEPRTLECGATTIWDLALVPNSTTLLVALGGWDEDAPIQQWDYSSGEQLATLRGHSSGATSLAVAADGKTLYSTGWDRTAIVWDLANDEVRQQLRGPAGRLFAAVPVASANTLLAGGYDGLLHRWELDATDLRRDIPQDREEKFNAIRFSPAGDHFATIAEKGFVRIWESQSFADVLKPKGHYRVVRALAYHPDGDHLASAGHGGEIRMWSTTTGEMVHQLDGHQSRVWDLAFSRDGRMLYSVAGLWLGAGELIVWDVNSQTLQASFRPSDDDGEDKSVMRSVAVAPDDRYIAVARNVNYQPGVIELRDAQTLELQHVLDGHSRDVNAVRFHPDLPILASGDAGGSLRLWNLDSRECYAILSGHETEITALVFSPDGRTLVSGSVDGVIQMWEPQIGNSVGALAAGADNLWSLDFSPDGRTLAAAMDHLLAIWSLPAMPTSRVASAKLFPVPHPSASGTRSGVDVQWQLSETLLQQAGVDPRWVPLALQNAEYWNEARPGNEARWEDLISRAKSRQQPE